MLEQFVKKVQSVMQRNGFSANGDTLSPACQQLLKTYPLDGEESGAGVLAVGVYPELRSVVVYFQLPIEQGQTTNYAGFSARVIKVTFIDVPDASISYNGNALVHNELVTLPPGAEDDWEHGIDEFQLKRGNEHHLIVCEAENLTMMFPFKDWVYEEVDPTTLGGTKSSI